MLRRTTCPGPAISIWLPSHCRCAWWRRICYRCREAMEVFARLGVALVAGLCLGCHPLGPFGIKPSRPRKSTVSSKGSTPWAHPVDQTPRGPRKGQQAGREGTSTPDKPTSAAVNSRKCPVLNIAANARSVRRRETQVMRIATPTRYPLYWRSHLSGAAQDMGEATMRGVVGPIRVSSTFRTDRCAWNY